MLFIGVAQAAELRDLPKMIRMGDRRAGNEEEDIPGASSLNLEFSLSDLSLFPAGLYLLLTSPVFSAP